MKISNTLYGIKYSSKSLEVFFGNKNFLDVHSKRILYYGHQTHAADLISVNNLNLQGGSTLVQPSDGLHSSQPNKTLAIVTADCIPCFIYSTNQIYSLHLGWRGLEKGLFDNALKKCGQNIKIFIGPHITQQSFEVESNVVDTFKIQLPVFEKNWFTQKNKTKYHISLLKILIIKAKKFNFQIFHSKTDTFTNKLYNSYRRDNQTSKRNISFAFLKNKVKYSNDE